MKNKFFSSVCVAGIVMHEGNVLLVRHTYGSSKGKYLIPGGYLQEDEIPTQAIVREIYEETHINTKVNNLCFMRFKFKEWCAIFSMDYLNGVPLSDEYENDIALFIPISDLYKYDLTDFTKYVLEQFLKNHKKQHLELKSYCPKKYNRKNYELF